MRDTGVNRLFNIYGFTGGSFAGNVYDVQGIAPTINTMGGGNREPMITVVGSKQQNAYRGSTENISPTLTEAMGMGGGQIPMLTDATIEETKTDNFMAQVRKQNLPERLKGKKFRVRKMTPRECFRLMGVDDKDIDKIQASGISNSAQYKLAGNSIVVDTLYHLFRKMFVETGNENKQLELF